MQRHRKVYKGTFKETDRKRVINQGCEMQRKKTIIRQTVGGKERYERKTKTKNRKRQKIRKRE